MTGNLQIKSNLLVLCAALVFFGAAQFASAQTAQPKPAQTQQKFVSLDEAVRLALAQASTFKQSQLNEQIAAQDVFQAKRAFLPKISANPTLVFTSPTLGAVTPGVPRPPSFLGANAITEYQGLVTASGEIDASGRLRANRRRAQFLLQAAQAGTETARRNLTGATEEAYFIFALAAAQKNSAEANLRTATEFENLTKLLVEGGEIAPVDLMRAQIQTTARRDELEQAKINERVAADNLRVYLGFDAAQEIAVSDLQTLLPETGELAQFSIEAAANRPELRQFQAETEAAGEEAKIAKAERKPQITYSIDGGFVSNSLRPRSVGSTTGIRATVGVSIPLFDWGASRSRQKQAELRAQISENSRLFATRQFAAQFDSNLAQGTSAASRIRSLADNLRNAEKILEVAILRYRAGETQIIEVTDAQTQIIIQRNALLQAIYDYRIAVARLKQATGK